jgi:hypothetical protein
VFNPPMMVGPWAFADPVEAVYGEAPRCPSCGTFIAGRPWVPPYRVRLIKGMKSAAPGDVITGPGIGGFLASQRFVVEFERANLKGIERWEPVDIEGYNDYEGSTLSRPSAPGRPFELAILPVPATRAVWEAMHPVFKGDVIGCDLCGRRGRILDSYQGVVVDEASWTGADIFELAHFGGDFIVTEAFVEFIASGEFTGIPLVPAAERVPYRAGEALGDWSAS